MGVRGLTTFIASRSHQYLEPYELHDTYVVLDGNNIAAQLYKWHCSKLCNDCFGGDYDKYAKIIYKFFQLLADCGVVPLLVFDGGYERRKLQTVYSRMNNKIHAAKDFSSVNEGSMTIFPLFLRELFIDIALTKLRMKCVRCDFECDNDVACIARMLRCPVLSYDSDFFIFDVLYIPFSTFELRLVNKSNQYNFVPCRVYRVDKFLNSFDGGFDKTNLPLLAMLLGNDYIRKSSFQLFYRHIKLPKSKSAPNDQQRRIKSMILWLRNETRDSAIQKILARFKAQRRRNLAAKIYEVLAGYECFDSIYLRYLDIDTAKVDQGPARQVPPPQIMEEDDVVMDDDLANDEEDDEAKSSSSLEFEHEQDKVIEDFTRITDLFRENYRKCLYPSCFMDIVVQNTYYSTPQVEDYSSPHSHSISLTILSAIHRILTSTRRRCLICVARNDESDQIQKFIVPLYDSCLPNLSEIHAMDLMARKRIVCYILNFQADSTIDFLALFPESWSLFLLSVLYWVANAKAAKIDKSLVYAVILCAIQVNSTVVVCANGDGDTTNNKIIRIKKSFIIEALKAIDSNERRLLRQYFEMDEKMTSNPRLFDRALVHALAEFQSCFLHIKYLNSLFRLPFVMPCLASDFYNGTFVYNMTVNLRKRADLTLYVEQTLFKECPTMLHGFQLILERVLGQCDNECLVEAHKSKKRRRRRKKRKDMETDVEVYGNDNNDDESNDEGIVDANNKFAVLAMCNNDK